MFDDYIFLVDETVDRYASCILKSLPYDQARKIGEIGLKKAISKYSADKGSFIMYAKSEIYNEMVDAVVEFVAAQGR